MFPIQNKIDNNKKFSIIFFQLFKILFKEFLFIVIYTSNIYSNLVFQNI